MATPPAVDHPPTDLQDGTGPVTAVLDVRGLQWASQQNTLDAPLRRRPGVLDIAVNPVAQTATVVFDPAVRWRTN